MSPTPSQPSPDPDGVPEAPSPSGPLAGRPALNRLAHVLAWTLVFYLLTYGIAKLCEWLSRL